MGSYPSGFEDGGGGDLLEGALGTEDEEVNYETTADEDNVKSESSAHVASKKEDSSASLLDQLTEEVAKLHLDRVPDAPSSLQTLARWIQDSQRVLVLTGAGVSVSAGIPDFRTPGTGLYDNLQKYDLPYPEAVFDLDFYRRHPRPFCSLAKEIWPGVKFGPTLTHSFVALLSKQKKLLRLYSQNIDGLEWLAGIPESQLIECHGHFRTASCIACKQEADGDKVKHTILETSQVPVCDSCGSYVKPDIVFFGEGLPQRFHTSLQRDLHRADLCLIMGTSLMVAPVSMIPDMVRCRRALVNRERVGNLSDNQQRDVFHAGDCDDSVRTLCQLVGWEDDLMELNLSRQISREEQIIRPEGGIDPDGDGGEDKE